MIKPEELRIGNWVEQPQLPHIRRITAIDYRGDDYYCKFKDIHAGCWCSEIEPIPITEEILIQCGFENVEVPINCGGTLFGYKADRFRTFILKYNLLNPTCFVEYNFEQPIESLHQLQNIIMDLYGKELEVNL